MRYAIAPGIGWLESADGGVDATCAWAVNRRTGDVYALEDAAWLIWMLLAEHPATLPALADRVAGAGAELTPEQVRAFVDELAGLGLVEGLSDGMSEGLSEGLSDGVSEDRDA